MRVLPPLLLYQFCQVLSSPLHTSFVADSSFPSLCKLPLPLGPSMCLILISPPQALSLPPASILSPGLYLSSPCPRYRSLPGALDSAAWFLPVTTLLSCPHLPCLPLQISLLPSLALPLPHHLPVSLQALPVFLHWFFLYWPFSHSVSRIVPGLCPAPSRGSPASPPESQCGLSPPLPPCPEAAGMVF